MMRNLKRRGLLFTAIASGALLVSGCATETTYRPATGKGFYRTGYSERQVEADRWLVTFAGNTVTDRDTVERYLLFRAAQLTLQNGYDYFVMVDRSTDRQAQTYSTPGPGWGGGWGGGWGPSWRYYGRGFGWRAWDPWWGDPFWGNNIDVRTVDRYEASAEIVMRKGTPAKDEVRAFNARDVADRIGPTVVMPKS
ncbi:CC0125/CC1285 family lipoprotein [Sphingomonas lycopersici]|uniref:CC0125/CC1285 family lipoprotein n=1 Tax=Sphingomonas lycopersici TaxID=2951807 RepID=UPI003D7BEB6E